MGISHRDILTSQALKFAVDWLEDNPVQIAALKQALAEQMEQWEAASPVPKAPREAIVETVASRAVRQHIEKLKTRRPWWQRA
ncbi:hypothetical protein P8631_01260 [Guyparkeria sp. 1SP6A2]|nr:hypothetical protein [Guyparkeria sp. 1SP6A2]